MEKNIIESNKLIAEFDGLIYLPDNDYYLLNPEELVYNERWDWLMPVIQKINGWNIKDNPEIIIDNSVTTYLKVRKPLYKALHSINLPETYNAVVQILEWHNTLIPTPEV